MELTHAALRERAEASLAQGASAQLLDISDTAKMVHELQVAEIELRMQNQALCDALYEAERYKARYQDLYEFAPVAYLGIRRDCTIAKLNRHAMALLGGEPQTPEVLLGQPITRFMVGESVERIRAMLAEAFSGGLSPLQELQMCPRPVVPVYVSARAQAEASQGTSELQVRLELTDVSALRTATDDVVQHLLARCG